MTEESEAKPRGPFSLPPGLRYCENCGSPRGETVVRTDEDHCAVLARSTCWCGGPRCSRCGDVRSRRPISDHYDPVKRGWWHVPHFVGFRTLCPRCRDEQAHEKEQMTDSDEIPLWLDDDVANRASPAGWTQVTTAWQAIEKLETGSVVELSLDHDLGGDDECGTGGTVVDFLCERSFDGRPLWPRDGITLHTANAYGRNSMARAIERYAGRDVRVHRGMNGNGQPTFTFG